MAARSHAMSHVHSFVNALTRWVEALGGTTIDMLFIVVGCMECTLIFDVRFHTEMLNDGPRPPLQRCD